MKFLSNIHSTVHPEQDPATEHDDEEVTTKTTVRSQFSPFGRSLHKKFLKNIFTGNNEKKSDESLPHEFDPVENFDELRQRTVVSLPEVEELLKVGIDMEDSNDAAKVIILISDWLIVLLICLLIGQVMFVMRTEQKEMKFSKERFLPVLQALMDTLENLEKDEESTDNN